MLAKLLNPPSVVKAESRMTQLHAVEKASPWASKFGWFNHGRCQKAMALRGMKDNVRSARHACSPLSHYTVLLLCKPSCNAMMVSFEMNCLSFELSTIHSYNYYIFFPTSCFIHFTTRTRVFTFLHPLTALNVDCVS